MEGERGQGEGLKHDRMKQNLGGRPQCRWVRSTSDNPVWVCQTCFVGYPGTKEKEVVLQLTTIRDMKENIENEEKIHCKEIRQIIVVHKISFLDDLRFKFHSLHRVKILKICQIYSAS